MAEAATDTRSSTSTAPARASGGGYDISRAAGRCAVSGRAIAPTEKFMTALRDSPAGFERVDVAMENWAGFDQAGLLGYWQTTMPRPEEKKKLFVDDAVLLELFERLEGNDDASRQNFRFVLGLILMRKRLLAYESSVQTENDKEVWLMRVKGRDGATLNLVNPHLGEQQVADVSRQLSEVLAEG